MGNFERMAPNAYSEKLVKLVGGQKQFGSLMRVPPKDPKDDLPAPSPAPTSSKQQPQTSKN